MLAARNTIDQTLTSFDLFIIKTSTAIRQKYKNQKNTGWIKQEMKLRNNLKVIGFLKYD